MVPAAPGRPIFSSRPPPPPSVPSFVGPAFPHGIPRFAAAYTVQSVKDGRWSQSSTWYPRVPVDGDVVSITHQVTVDVQTARVVALEVFGALINTNQRLRVVTLIVYPGGLLEMGNDEQSAIGAELELLDAPIDTTLDPEQIGHGLIGLGTIRICGVEKTSWFRLRSEVSAGATSLPVTVEGWEVGDRLFLPDTRQLAYSATYTPRWELPTVASVGTSIGLQTPLQWTHEGCRDKDGVITRLPHVANRTRSVTIRSENPAGVRGHTIFSEHCELDVCHVQFQDLGRTLAFVAGKPNNVSHLDNTTYNAQGQVAHIGTNQIGRYALHVHHLMGPMPMPGMPQFRIENCVVDRSKKFGIAVHHSHYGHILDNVVVFADGSGFMFEDGSETENLVEGNFCGGMLATVGGRGDERGMVDLGWQGTAFYFRGPNNRVRGNVGCNAPQDYGFKLFSYQLGTIQIPTGPGSMTTIPVDGNSLPILEWSDNESYTNRYGMTYWWINAKSNVPNPQAKESLILRQTIWHVMTYGIFHYPSSKVTIEDLVIRNKGDVAIGVYGADYFARDWTLRNVDIQGCLYGWSPSVNNGPQRLEHGYFRNAKNLRKETLWTSAAEARSITARALMVIGLRAPSGIPITCEYSVQPVRNVVQTDTLEVVDFQGVSGDTFRVYYAQQLPTVIVPDTVISQFQTHYLEGLPVGVTGLTNTQALAQFGLAIAGGISPCATTRPGIPGGVVC